MTEPTTQRFPSGCLMVTGGVEADDAAEAGGASGKLHRGSAIGAVGVWAGVSELPPGEHSVSHHHGDQATIVYLVTGAMTFRIMGDDPHEFTAHAGDFVVVPAGVIHAEENPSATDGCLCVVVRTPGEAPLVFNEAS